MSTQTEVSSARLYGGEIPPRFLPPEIGPVNRPRPVISSTTKNSTLKFKNNLKGSVLRPPLCRKSPTPPSRPSPRGVWREDRGPVSVVTVLLRVDLTLSDSRPGPKTGETEGPRDLFQDLSDDSTTGQRSGFLCVLHTDYPVLRSLRTGAGRGGWKDFRSVEPVSESDTRR